MNSGFGNTLASTVDLDLNSSCEICTRPLGEWAEEVILGGEDVDEEENEEEAEEEKTTQSFPHHTQHGKLKLLFNPDKNTSWQLWMRRHHKQLTLPSDHATHPLMHICHAACYREFLYEFETVLHQEHSRGTQSPLQFPKQLQPITNYYKYMLDRIMLPTLAPPLSKSQESRLSLAMLLRIQRDVDSPTIQGNEWQAPSLRKIGKYYCQRLSKWDLCAGHKSEQLMNMIHGACEQMFVEGVHFRFWLTRNCDSAMANVQHFFLWIGQDTPCPTGLRDGLTIERDAGLFAHVDAIVSAHRAAQGIADAMNNIHVFFQDLRQYYDPAISQEDVTMPNWTYYHNTCLRESSTRLGLVLSPGSQWKINPFVITYDGTAPQSIEDDSVMQIVWPASLDIGMDRDEGNDMANYAHILRNKCIELGIQDMHLPPVYLSDSSALDMSRTPK